MGELEVVYARLANRYGWERTPARRSGSKSTFWNGAFSGSFGPYSFAKRPLKYMSSVRRNSRKSDEPLLSTSSSESSSDVRRSEITSGVNSGNALGSFDKSRGWDIFSQPRKNSRS